METQSFKDTISAIYKFTPEEIKDFGGRLAKKWEEKEQIVEEFKSVKKQWTLRIEGIDNEISSFAHKISSGHEYRQTEVRVEFDPKNGKKTFFRLTDGEKVGEADMLPADYQLTLVPEEPAEPIDPEEDENEDETPPAKPEEDDDADAPEDEPVSTAKTPVEEEPEKPSTKKGVRSRKKKEVDIDEDNPFSTN